jgi:acyl-coenzyme A thioesterase PaaI-like protein
MSQIVKYRVTAKQPNSRMCIVCGLSNPRGLRALFYELDCRQVVSVFQPVDQLQGYPGRLHGGIASMILDETIGRAIMIDHGSRIWGVTISLQTRFRQPIPTDIPVRTMGRIENASHRHFVGTGRIVLPDGSTAVEATGKYLKLPIEQIANFDFDHEHWRVHPAADDPVEMEI